MPYNPVYMSRLTRFTDLFDAMLSLMTFIPDSETFVIYFAVLFSKFSEFQTDDCNLRTIHLLKSVLVQPHQAQRPNQHAQIHDFMDVCLRSFLAGGRQEPFFRVKPPNQEVLDTIPTVGVEAPTEEDLERMQAEMHRLGTEMGRKSKRFLDIEEPRARGHAQGAQV